MNSNTDTSEENNNSSVIDKSEGNRILLNRVR